MKRQKELGIRGLSHTCCAMQGTTMRTHAAIPLLELLEQLWQELWIAKCVAGI